MSDHIDHNTGHKTGHRTGRGRRRARTQIGFSRALRKKQTSVFDIIGRGKGRVTGRQRISNLLKGPRR